MDKPVKFQIPNETAAPVAKALRAFERQTTEIVESLNNPAERLAFYGASQVWLAENQKALVLPAGKTHGAGASAPEPHAG